MEKWQFLVKLSNMSEQILKLEDIIDEKKNGTEKKKKKKIKQKSKIEATCRGVPKSGRTWKTPKSRFSSIIKTRGYKIANKFEKLLSLKHSIARAQSLSRCIVEKKQQEIENKKARRRRNLKRQEQNRLKSEVVQIISNTAKIKRMKKKQLRNIEKRDILNMS